MPKVRVSYRLEEDADKIIRNLAESWGVSQAQVIEILVREAKGRKLKTAGR